jgi:hypothetical protein
MRRGDAHGIAAARGRKKAGRGRPGHAGKRGVAGHKRQAFAQSGRGNPEIVFPHLKGKLRLKAAGKNGEFPPKGKRLKTTEETADFGPGGAHGVFTERYDADHLGLVAVRVEQRLAWAKIPRPEFVGEVDEKRSVK